MLVGLCAGLAVPMISWGPRLPSAPVTHALVTIGIGLLGAVTLIFSLLFLVVQWVMSTFTPRLMLFRDDPFVWRTFGFALGLVVFCMAAAFAVGRSPEVSAAVPVLAMLELLVLVALLRALQLRAFAAIQLAPALGTIADHGRTVLTTLYTEHRHDSPPLPPVRSTVVWRQPPVVLQRVETAELIVAATAANVTIVLRQNPGATLHHGSHVADVHGGELAEARVLGSLVVGAERTFEQDPLLAFRLLADIALRALSPAVNDPATAVQAFDELADLLGWVAEAPLGPLRVTDDAGVDRLVVHLPGWEEFLRTSVDDIAFVARSPMVVIGLRDSLRRVRDRATPEHVELLDRWLARLDHQVTRL
ncbi:putative membrane protein [Nocardia alba]|uniref:Putative membrane protein n=2 Tax=Nocardia alba TaxID=225051 RepID=A0A4R1FMU1_9NOCA|nr:putative membrane protein [Nocardia alba]